MLTAPLLLSLPLPLLLLLLSSSVMLQVLQVLDTRISSSISTNGEQGSSSTGGTCRLTNNKADHAKVQLLLPVVHSSSTARVHLPTSRTCWLQS
jgi:hypothetical protein